MLSLLLNILLHDLCTVVEFDHHTHIGVSSRGVSVNLSRVERGVRQRSARHISARRRGNNRIGVRRRGGRGRLPGVLHGFFWWSVHRVAVWQFGVELMVVDGF